MRKIILASTLLFALASCSERKKESSDNVSNQDSTQVAAVYHCPMDCESGKTYDKPGQCPVCGMDLEKKS